MNNNIFRKCIVLGLIFLFTGSCIVPAFGYESINENREPIDKINYEGIIEEKLLLSNNNLDNITVSVTTDKTIYRRFEPIKIIVSVTNNGDEDWHHRFPDSQLADFDINNLYLWSLDYLFFQIVTPLTVRSGETIILIQCYWYQFTKIFNDGWVLRYPVPPGNYTIRGWMAFSYGPTPPFGYTNITIKSSISRSVDQRSTNNDFYRCIYPLLSRYLARFPMLERLLGLIN